jgi:hypothetical protein
MLDELSKADDPSIRLRALRLSGQGTAAKIKKLEAEVQASDRVSALLKFPSGEAGKLSPSPLGLLSTSDLRNEWQPSTQIVPLRNS